MLRPSVLLLALTVSAPTVWDALAGQSVSLTTALVHYLVAVPIMALLCAGVRLAMRPAEPRPASRSANEPSVPDA